MNNKYWYNNRTVDTGQQNKQNKENNSTTIDGK